MLQYITADPGKGKSVLQQAKEVLDGGCRWIQVRIKNASDDEVRKAIEEIKPLCAEYEAFLILNDRVELAKELEVSGVHIGQEDMPVAQARLLLGAGPVLGVTCNTYEEIKAVADQDIDYIGVGPFRYTTTKEHLRKLIGIEGYSSIIEQMRQDGIDNIPVVAVGGITADDVQDLMQTGVKGVAVSGAISAAEDLTAATENFITKLEAYYSND